ncbi:uncharacterized protein DSM5745_02720 [Aspergillus mulundensis]|uniref:F-box domain-containing protein n=1 Tax=Aspergillus mulundensis TaxID=1810919 RepID=A0A3D8SJX5_9EURO|nr:hypothetical protein DSM5745_02720 [Aspergillus mulundensis]RDW86078.1 hypothetical protein DSM5745_02720 [Aspergillus mulundensis]
MSNPSTADPYKKKVSLTALPVELILQITSSLRTRDLSALRLTNTHLSTIVDPQFTKKAFSTLSTNLSTPSLHRLNQISTSRFAPAVTHLLINPNPSTFHNALGYGTPWPRTQESWERNPKSGPATLARILSNLPNCTAFSLKQIGLDFGVRGYTDLLPQPVWNAKKSERVVLSDVVALLLTLLQHEKRSVSSFELEAVHEGINKTGLTLIASAFLIEGFAPAKYDFAIFGGLKELKVSYTLEHPLHGKFVAEILSHAPALENLLLNVRSATARGGRALFSTIFAVDFKCPFSLRRFKLAGARNNRHLVSRAGLARFILAQRGTLRVLDLTTIRLMETGNADADADADWDPVSGRHKGNEWVLFFSALKSASFPALRRIHLAGLELQDGYPTLDENMEQDVPCHKHVVFLAEAEFVPLGMDVPLLRGGKETACVRYDGCVEGVGAVLGMVCKCVVLRECEYVREAWMD